MQNREVWILTHTNVKFHYRRTRKGRVAKVKQHTRKVKDYIKGGMAKGRPDSRYNKKQLVMGRKVEREHTNDPRIANEIAKDHLEEFPNYYTELAKTEKKLEGQKRKKNFGMGWYKIYNSKTGKEGQDIQTFDEVVTPELKEWLKKKGSKTPVEVDDVIETIVIQSPGEKRRVFSEVLKPYSTREDMEDKYDELVLKNIKKRAADIGFAVEKVGLQGPLELMQIEKGHKVRKPINKSIILDKNILEEVEA
jgi:hypothetical protein